MNIGFPFPPDGNAPVYFATGETVWDAVFSLVNRPENPALGFVVTLAPGDTFKRLHIGYPAAWGRARFTLDGFDQTGAFGSPRVINSAGVTCYFYSSNQRVRGDNLQITVGA